MRLASLGLVIVLGSTSPARAAMCTYGVSYIDPVIHGACFVDAVAGCPVHVVLLFRPPQAEITPTVFCDGKVISVASTAVIIGIARLSITTFDYSSCDCCRTTTAMQFDEIVLTLTGVRAGDVVLLEGTEITI